MKHKHYDMIVAWAEGKQIQNFNENTGEWQDLIAPPYWIQNFQYRIKPETTFTSSKFDLNLRFTVQTNGGLHKIVGVELRDE